MFHEIFQGSLFRNRRVVLPKKAETHGFTTVAGYMPRRKCPVPYVERFAGRLPPIFPLRIW
jgi:hypothetical protein